MTIPRILVLWRSRRPTGCRCTSASWSGRSSSSRSCSALTRSPIAPGTRPALETPASLPPRRLARVRTRRGTFVYELVPGAVDSPRAGARRDRVGGYSVFAEQAGIAISLCRVPYLLHSESTLAAPRSRAVDRQAGLRPAAIAGRSGPRDRDGGGPRSSTTTGSRRSGSGLCRTRSTSQPTANGRQGSGSRARGAGCVGASRPVRSLRGRLVEDKGILDLLEARALLGARGPDSSSRATVCSSGRSARQRACTTSASSSPSGWGALRAGRLDGRSLPAGAVGCRRQRGARQRLPGDRDRSGRRRRGSRRERRQRARGAGCFPRGARGARVRRGLEADGRPGARGDREVDVRTTPPSSSSRRSSSLSAKNLGGAPRPATRSRRPARHRAPGRHARASRGSSGGARDTPRKAARPRAGR